MRTVRDLTGDVYGRLTVISRADALKRSNGKVADYRWNCQCLCGKSKAILANHLRSGKTTSCGCYHAEITSGLFYKHGESRRLDGSKATPEYGTWNSMKWRCLDKDCPAYDRYGGRGIAVCERWLASYQNFLEDMGRRPSADHSIERADNNGNYEPSNCYWATTDEQIRNRSVTRWITYNEETRTITEWANLIGIARKTIDSRLKRGLTVDAAFAKPPHTLTK